MRTLVRSCILLAMFAACLARAQTAQLIVTAPALLAGSYAAVTYNTAPSNVTATTPVDQGDIFIYDGVNCATHTLTKPIPGSGAGKVAFLTGSYPSTCTYYDDVVRELQADGAIAVIFGLANGTWRTVLLHGNASGLTVPVLYMQVDEVSQRIRSAVVAGSVVRVAFAAVAGMALGEDIDWFVPGETRPLTLVPLGQPSTGATWDLATFDIDRTLSGNQQDFSYAAGSACAAVSYHWDPAKHLLTATLAAGAAYTGTCTKTYLIRDTAGYQGIGFVTLYIGVPYAQSDYAQTAPDTPVLIDVLANDLGQLSVKVASHIDLDPSSAAVDPSISAASGTWSVEGGGVKFTPAPGFIGIATAQYAVRGGTGGASNTVTVTVLVGVDYQGMWWNFPAGSESGWGINFAHQGDTIFATWFTFDADGKPTWMVVAASRTGPNTYSGKIYTGTGPAFSADPFDPKLVVPTEIGTATFVFYGADRASFSYTINGVSRMKTITREIFSSPVPTCIWGGPTDFGLAVNFQDMWWAWPAGSQSGWGINFAHQGDTIFATWFTFGLDGKPLWFVVAASKIAPNTYTGKVFTGTGPAFNAVPFDPAKVVAVEVGTATFTFVDGNNATFVYTVYGVSQTKQITREEFASPRTVCQ